MNVAFCIPDMIIGGVESVFIRTLEEMLKKVSESGKGDLKICVITHAKIKEPLYVDWFRKHPEIELRVCYPLQNFFEGMIKYTNFFPVRQLRKISFSLYKKIKQINIRKNFEDIDVCIDYKNASFFKELAFFKGRKITWIHGSVKYLTACGIDKHLCGYDKIIGLTDAFVKDFKVAFPALKDRVLRIYNPIDRATIRKMTKRGDRLSGKFFCQVSRLENFQKDLDTLILAFNDFYLQNEKPNVRLVIVGGGPREKKLKKMVAALPCSGNVVFTGAIKNPLGYMESAMGLILSSKIEGLPTVLLESMAVGTLCVASDCQYGPREILMDGKAGILFEVGNVKQLSGIMSDLYNNKINTKKFIENATLSLDRFEPSLINEQIWNLIWK